MNEKAQACGSDSSLELGELPKPTLFAPQMITEDAYTSRQMRAYAAKQVRAAVAADLQARYEMLKSWLVEADASNDRLRTHLSNTLEIAYTWQPGYATKMDRDTLALAAQAIGYCDPSNEDK